MSVISQFFIKMKGIAGLFTEFLGKNRGIQALFIHHHSRAKVSNNVTKKTRLL
jgi:hypothetical protein